MKGNCSEIGPLSDIANRVVFRNVRGTEKFIKEKLVGYVWYGRPNNFKKTCGTFLFLILCINFTD